MPATGVACSFHRGVDGLDTILDQAGELGVERYGERLGFELHGRLGSAGLARHCNRQTDHQPVQKCARHETPLGCQ